MKRRQKPVILITVLVICAGLVFIMNAPAPAPPKPGDPPPPQPNSAPQSGIKLDVPTKDAIASGVAAQMSAGPQPVKQMEHPLGGKQIPGMPGVAPTKPSIVIEKSAPYKPVPSDTSVNSGWYTNEAPKSYAPPKTTN